MKKNINSFCAWSYSVYNKISIIIKTYCKKTISIPDLESTKFFNSCPKCGKEIKLVSKKVIIISPYKGKNGEEVCKNITYCTEACQDSMFNHGESPIAFHLIYPLFLNDEEDFQKNLGMTCAYNWFSSCATVVVYEDLGISPGMKQDIEKAKELNIPIIKRKIYEIKITKITKID